MPNSTQDQALRRDTIRRLLARAPAETQQTLVDELEARGMVATQSSVSRDLRELGAVKTTLGYELPENSAQSSTEIAAIAEFVRGVSPAGPNLTVIKSAIGAAPRVALAIDRSNWPEMIGNIGGDDTVFLATASAADQRRVINRLESARS
jgi:transcriptional regulator of arginine metabolism